MVKRLFSISIAIMLAGLTGAGWLALHAAPEVSGPALALSPTRFMRDVIWLASDDLKGRGDGSPELDRAADYIAREFQRAGLTPAGEHNSYFQDFNITTGAQPGPGNRFVVGSTTLTEGRDFVPVPFSSSSRVSGPLVFAGYGITAPEYHYDDYAGLDVSGKTVLVLGHEPQEQDRNSVFAGANFTRHASLTSKAVNAKQHGARAVIVITDFIHPQEDIAAATRNEDFADSGIVAIYALRQPFEEALKAHGIDIAAIQHQIDSDLHPRSSEIPQLGVDLVSDVVRTRKTVRNVMGALPGNDPKLKDQWLVVGAHYDHLGLGGRNSLAPSLIGQIHHGADDNASGTAGVMEFARIAEIAPERWHRSLLFMTYAGEEIGLLGSSWFVNHPTVPLNKIDAMVNMDMIGRMTRDRLYVGGVGTSPELKPLVQSLDSRQDPALIFTDTGYGSSDHTSFNAKKIPVMFFFSGLHTDYHKPSDTADKINASGAMEILALVYGVMDRLSAEPQKLPYVELKQDLPQPATPRSRGYGPYFGSVPDFRDDLKGVLFSAVQDDSPAAKAGLKAGDLLIRFDGKPIQNLNDYAYALRAKQPGDVVQVVVQRGGRDVQAAVTLEARK
jgi:aminopeptidase YwaD